MRSVAHFLIGFMVSLLLLSMAFFAIHSRLELNAAQVGIALACFVVSIPIHELIHGLTCAYVSANDCTTITYGISLRQMRAFCRYTLPVKSSMAYWITLMPGIVLALFPALAALILGNEVVCLFAALSFGGASSDIHKAWMRYSKGRCGSDTAKI